jgi:FkbM family methyltransferase
MNKPPTEPVKVTYPRYTLLQPWRYGYLVSMINDVQTIAVAVQGDSLPVESEILCSLLKHGQVVVDVGSSVGSLAIAFASAVGPTGKVFAFEPQTLPYQCLVANIAINSLSHVIVPVNAAVGAQSGEIDVPQLDPRDPDFGGCSLIVGWPGYFTDKQDLPKLPMPMTTVDSADLPACHMIKVDVEGMEPDVLRGAFRTISKYRPMLWVEHLDYVNWRPDTKADLLSIFAEHDYAAWKIATPTFAANNIRRQTQSPFSAGTGDQNVLALPREAGTPDFSRFECIQVEFT